MQQPRRSAWAATEDGNAAPRSEMVKSPSNASSFGGGGSNAATIHSTALLRSVLTQQRGSERKVRMSSDAPGSPLRYEEAEEVKLFEPAAPDTDLFHFEEVDVPQQNLLALANAAVAVSKIHSGLINAVTKLQKAATEEHAQTDGMRVQQQRMSSRVDTIWHIAAEVREETNELSTSLQRQVRAAQEIQEFYQAESKRQTRTIEGLVKITKRHRACSLLFVSNGLHERNLLQRFVRRYYRHWYNHSLLKKTLFRIMIGGCQQLTSRTYFIWQKLLLQRRQRRQTYRTSNILLLQTARRLISIRFASWRVWAALRARLRESLHSLRMGTAKRLVATYFMKWTLLPPFNRRVRRKLALQRTLLQHSARVLLTRRYSLWLEYTRQRQKRRRRYRLSLQILSQNCVRLLRSILHRWLRIHRNRYEFKKKLVDMRTKNMACVMKDYFRRWQKLQTMQWVANQVEDHLAGLNNKVEIGLRTSANTNETIQKLIEYCGQLEKRLVDLARTKVSHHELRPAAYRRAGGVDELGALANEGEVPPPSTVPPPQPAPASSLLNSRYGTEDDGLAPFDLNVEPAAFAPTARVPPRSASASVASTQPPPHVAIKTDINLQRRPLPTPSEQASLLARVIAGPHRGLHTGQR